MEIDIATILYYLSIPVMIAVAIVLLVGLFTMMKGGDPKKQNKMMFARVYLQAIAVALMVGAVYLAGAR
ncbi:MAG: twin transmembrane helix small protein [Pseudomonadota bacterium]